MGTIHTSVSLSPEAEISVIMADFDRAVVMASGLRLSMSRAQLDTLIEKASAFREPENETIRIGQWVTTDGTCVRRVRAITAEEIFFDRFDVIDSTVGSVPVSRPEHGWRREWYDFTVVDFVPVEERVVAK